jgi:hypothetical protein
VVEIKTEGFYYVAKIITLWLTGFAASRPRRKHAGMRSPCVRVAPSRGEAMSIYLINKKLFKI